MTIGTNRSSSGFPTFTDTGQMADTLLPVGSEAKTKELYPGVGRGQTYDVVLTSTVIPNAVTIIRGTADPLVSYVLRVEDGYIAPTVADMKILPVKSGIVVETESYYSGTNDGSGAATYKILTLAQYGGTPDEFGDHTLDNGNVAKLQTANDELNVKQFGAKGDGIADDTPAIQAALDAAEIIVAAIGGTLYQVTSGVFVPGGEYSITGVVMGEGVVMRGEGQNISMFKTVGAVTAITMGQSGGTYSGSWLIDVGVWGDSTTAGSVGIQTYGQIRNCGILRCFVLDCDTLIKWGEAFATHLEDCHLRNGGTYCFDVDNGSHSVIKGCRFDVSGGHAVRIIGTTIETVNISFQDCSFQSAQLSGCIGVDVGSASFIDCDFESNNKIDSLTNANLKFIQAGAAGTHNVYNIQGGFYAVGSSAGTNHVGITVENADTVNVSGVFMRGANFAKGVEMETGVSKLNLHGNYFQSVTIPIEVSSSTVVTDTRDAGSFMNNNVAFDTSSDYSRQDGMVLRNLAQAPGLGNYGGSLSATSNYANVRRAAIAAKQTGSDADQIGWAFLTHPSSSSVDIAETLVLNHTGELELGGTGGPKVVTGSGSPEGSVTAPVGSTFHRSDGGSGTSFYVKESGTGNTGWTGK